MNLKTVIARTISVGAVVLAAGCERAEEERAEVTAIVAHPVPPPKAEGAEIATLLIKPPPGNVGRPVFAGLKREGRIVARGEAVVSSNAVTEVVLHTLDKTVEMRKGDYDLWLVIDRDGLQACHPSFGDLYLRDTWQKPKTGQTVRYDDPAAWKFRRLSRAANQITVHYRRYDEDYDDVGIWSWDAAGKKSPEQNELFEVGRDDFGLVFQFDRSEYGLNGDSEKIGLVPRLGASWDRKDGDDKFWTPSLGKEVYLVGTRNKIWATKPVIADEVVTAHVDTRDRVVVQLSRPLRTGEVAAGTIRIADRTGKTTPIASAELLRGGKKRKSNAIMVTTAQPLDIAGNEYSISIDGFAGSVTTVPRGILDDATLFCDANAVLGATYSAEATTFRVFAPTARAVNIVLYDAATGSAGRRLVAVAATGRGIWETRVAGDLKGKFYLYSLDGDNLSPEHEVLDIYCVNAVDSSRRARITDLPETNPPGWDTGRRGPVVAAPQDMVVYEMHVRDFSIAANSGMEHKGKYLAFTEAGTHLPGEPAMKTGLDHLAELGITHVQLLPIQDFGNDEASTNYNWGYVTMTFNTPEGWFATNANDDSRVREVKELVHALHERGIGVIMDVVYNHTANNAPFNLLVPRYYYRFMPDGGYANGSGCGNDFRTESPMGRKYIIDTLKYWVQEYGIDGFRFDLMALIDLDTMKEVERELRAIRPDLVLYGEPWGGGGNSPLKHPTTKQTITGTQLGAFNNEIRDALVGSPFNKTHGGFVQDGSSRDGVERGLQGQWRDWGDGPHQVINYLSCHDNYVVYDKLKASKPGASHKDIIEMMKVGYLLLFTAQGVPFIHGGEEFARTKQSHENSYNAPDEVNEVDWSLKKENYDLFTYVRDLIALRKAHPVFRMRVKEQIGAWLKFPETNDLNLLMYTYEAGNVDGEPWKQVCVIVNSADAISTEVTLPPGDWHVAFDQTGAVTTDRLVQGTAHIRYKSGLILFQ